MGDQAAAAVMTAAAVTSHGNPMKEKYEKRYKRCKHATIAFYVLMVVFIIIGIVIIAFFASQWSAAKWKTIVGIVFLFLGLLFMAAAIIATVIICKIFRSMDSVGDPVRPVPPNVLANLKYPRQQQQEFEPIAEPLDK